MNKKYEATWESLKHIECPEWFSDVKFGIFIHWGVYSLPGEGCWYGHGMYTPNYLGTNSGIEGKITWYESHLEKYGDPSEFGYKDLIPLFKADKFNPQEWMDLVEGSGAGFVMPVTDFHDAFAMYDSDLTPYTAVKMGPKRNIIEELRQEALKRDIKFCVSSHLAFNPIFFTKSPELDSWDEEYELLYGPKWDGNKLPQKWIDYWELRTKEMIDKTQPDQLWFDFGIERAEYYTAKKNVAAYYYNKAEEWGKEVLLTYKSDIYPKGTAVLDLERGALDDIQPWPWQTDTSVSIRDWSWVENEIYKDVDYLIGEFIDIVSKNGVLLLNFGPRPDGSIPREVVEIFQAFGKWLKINGEGIYNSRPWIVYGEGPTKLKSGHMNEIDNFGLKWTGKDIRFTQSKTGDALYLHFLDWPGEGKVNIATLNENTFIGKEIKGIELLGHGEIDYTLDKYGFNINMPKNRPCDYAVVVKVKLNS